MKISFVIPAHNESTFIEKCVKSIHNAKHYTDIEIIVVVSSTTTDQTHQVAINSGAICIQSTFSSRAKQMNEGARVATGEVLCFVHADVRLPEDNYELIKNTIEQGYQCGFFSYRFDKSSPFLKINELQTRKDGIFSGGGDQSLFIKSNQFYKLGGFNKNVAIMEDFEFFDRIKTKNINYKIITKDAVVSSRKYDKNSYLKVNVVNGLAFSLYKLGAPTKTIKTIFC